MLIFTYKLEKYFKNKILPKILLLPNNYVIKGSFRRKIPYVTDIDIVNTVYPKINRTNIYDHLIKLINSLGTYSESNIILVYITCGTDDRFRLTTGSDKEISRIKPLLTIKELEELELIIEKYSNNPDKKLFFINELIWPYYKLRWTPKNVLENSIELSGGLIVNFRETIEKNSVLLLQYYVRIGSYPIGIDVVVNYESVDMKTAYESAAEYQLKLANYSREYYYMLFPFKYFFRGNKEISRELEDLIEKTFGLYKQLMVRIDTYATLYKSNNLDINTATGIVTSILKDLHKLPGFSSNIPNKIREISINNTPKVKMAEWHVLLDLLYDEINAAVNTIAREYFYKYLEMLPENIKNKFYLKNTGPGRINKKLMM